MNDLRTSIEAAKLSFVQDGDSIIGGLQELEIGLEDAGAGAFITLKTDRWAIDSPDDLKKIFDFVEKLKYQIDEFNEVTQ